MTAKLIALTVTRALRASNHREYLPGMVAGFEEEEARAFIEKGWAVPYRSPEAAAVEEAERAAAVAEAAEEAERKRLEEARAERDRLEREENEALARLREKAEREEAAAHRTDLAPKTMEGITISMAGTGTVEPPPADPIAHGDSPEIIDPEATPPANPSKKKKGARS